jgi:[ribosomal protein S18]-alanine N-acetyltransferase
VPDTKPLAIRSARLNDVPLILAMERQAANASHWTAEQYEDLVDLGVVLVAEQSVNLCGFICARPIAGEWEIENVVVAAPLLRRGIASELMLALIQKARDEHASALLLEVRESNVAARRLYDKHGLHEVGRRRLYYQVPEEDAVLYTLQFEL